MPRSDRTKLSSDGADAADCCLSIRSEVTKHEGHEENEGGQGRSLNPLRFKLSAMSKLGIFLTELLLLLSIPPATTLADLSAAPLVLVDLNGPEAADRIAEIRESCPYATRGEARFELVDLTPEASSGRGLRFTYSLANSDPTPVGVYVRLSHLDASSYDHLELRIRAEGSAADLAPVRIGFRRPEPGGRGLVQTGSFVLRDVTSDWRTHQIPLNSMVGIRQWTELSDLFVTVEPSPSAARMGTYLLDDFVLRRTGQPGPSADDKPPMPHKRAWIAAAGSPEKARERKRERLAGWPQRLLVPRDELPSADAEFLRRLARDTWRGLDALRDREHDLPLDTVSFRKASRPEADRIGDYTNVTNVGLYLIAVVAAQELDFLQKTDALRRIEGVVRTLERLESHRGFFFNYYDTTTLERSSYFVSFVDSAWLTAGLMVVRSAFPELAERVAPLIDRTDYGFFYDAARGLMSHGVFVHLGVPSEYHYGLLYSESRLGSLIAIGKGDVPAEHWFRMRRILPAACAWQTQTPHVNARRKIDAHTIVEGQYEWGGVRYVPSWGGSMFEALMPALVVDEQRYAPASLGPNDLAHAVVQRRWATEAAQFPVWGISPSRDPAGGYGEYGVPVLGALGYRAGAVTPHAAALALAVTPAPAIVNLRRMVEQYDMYGEYGFYDSVEPKSGRVARDYLALDQAMTFLALANYLKPHCIQERFASDPIAERALPLLRDERFFK